MTSRRQDLARPQDQGRSQDQSRSQQLARPGQQERAEDRRSDQRKQTFSERLATGGWLLYVVEVLVLLVIFGWLFMTVSLAG